MNKIMLKVAKLNILYLNSARVKRVFNHYTWTNDKNLSQNTTHIMNNLSSSKSENVGLINNILERVFGLIRCVQVTIYTDLAKRSPGIRILL